MSTPLTYRDNLIDRYRLVYDWVPDGTRNLLDVGCGNGVFTQWLTRKAAAVTGTDHNAGQLEYARREFPAVTFEQAEGEALPFPDGAFDVVVMTEVLEHTTDDALALAETLRVLEPGGRLILTVPNAGPLALLDGDNLVNRFVWLLSRLRIPHGRDADGEPTTLYAGFEYVEHRHYHLKTLAAMLDGCGELETVHYGGTVIWPLTYLIEKIGDAFFKKPLITNPYRTLRRIRAWDFERGFGHWSYNLALRFRKNP